MLDDCTYDKVKLLHETSCLLWFVDKHAIPNAKKIGDAACAAFLEDFRKDLEKRVDTLKNMVGHGE